MIRNNEGIYQSELLLRFPWLSHGFGTRLSGSWPGPYVGVKQIHSNIVVVSDGLTPGTLSCQGDAVVTDRAGEWIGIRTADCIPILLVDPEHRAIAAVHAGWRGTASQILAGTVSKMREAYGSDPSQLVAAIGPGIGECCFEVGPEVADVFRPMLPERTEWRTVDLLESNRRQLVTSGVPEAGMDIARLCTKCLADQFHSYRRDASHAGRMTAAISIIES